ncbi:MAG: hypothetical protein L6Q92_06030 [Phycisphaerae bacterium]|nr:hypothetical protein [Phycisphaerae bacterium]
MPTTQPRRRRLPYVSQQTFLRRPVSDTRARIGWAILLLIALGYAIYRFRTTDEAIRRRAERFLQQATGGEVHVEKASFSLFGGIYLSKVRVSTPPDPTLDANAQDAVAREIFSASSVHLEHDPWRLPFELRVEQITATHPTLTIVQNIETGRFNWQSLFRTIEPRRMRREPQRPVMRLRDARVRFVTIDDTGRHPGDTVKLDVDAFPHLHPSETTTYLIDIRKYGHSPNRGRMTFDFAKGSVSDTPIIGLGEIRSLLPKVYQEFFAKLELKGDIRSRKLRYGGTQDEDREFDLWLRDVQFAIPLSMLRSGEATAAGLGSAVPRDETSPSNDAAFEFRGISGTLRLARGTVHLDLKGLLNGAEATVAGNISQIDLALDQVGLDLAAELRGAPMPEGNTRAKILESPTVPQKIREFFKHYDPFGKIDVDCRLRREAGPGRHVSFEGTLSPRGANAAYLWFPYRLHDLTGQVRFAADGIRLENLRGRHAAAELCLNGRVASPDWYTAVDLTIDASSVPLDAALYRCLGEKYRRIWQRFDPRGLARVSVDLKRSSGDPEHGPAPWETRVIADLVDTRVCFDQFPYPLERVRGRLAISPGVIRIDGLTGNPALAGALDPDTRRRPPVVRVDGYALDDSPDGAGTPTLELLVEADDLPLDDALGQALPPDARAAFRQFQPSGLVHLAGRVFSRPGQARLGYDMWAELRGATMQYEEFPYGITDIAGRLRITPDQVTLIDVNGRHGGARVHAQGDVSRLPDGHRADLTITVRDVRLDQTIESALPAPLKRVWELLSPRGTVNVTTRLHQLERNGNRRQAFRTEIELMGGRLRYHGFPLPLEEVEGHALVTDRRIELREMRGRCAGGSIVLSGSLDLDDGIRGGALRVEVRGIPLDEPLASALPAVVRDPWRQIRPRGRVDLENTVLRFRCEPDGGTRWDWEGRVTFHDASARVGMGLADVRGSIDGSGSFGGTGGVSLQAHARLSQARFGVFDLRGVELDASMKPDSRTLELSSIAAHLFGGDASGTFSVTFGPEHTDYSCTMYVQDAELAQYLDAANLQKQRASNAKGLLYGKLYLRGRAGDDASRRGGGEFFVRQAQVWQLPLALGVFQVLNLAPDQNMFHDGWLQFHLDGRTLRFSKIDLQGHAVSFLGGGTVDTESQQMDITLVAGSPHRLRVPLLSELFDEASRDLLGVHVTGTLGKPHVESRSLLELRRGLEAITEPNDPSDFRGR